MSQADSEGARAAAVKLWLEALFHRNARGEPTVDGVPISRNAVAARDVVELLGAAARPAAAELLERAEAHWQEARRARGTRFDALVERLGLGDAEQRIVAVLIAPERDAELERIFAYALNDFTRRRPDVGLLVDLLGANNARRREEVRTALTTDAALRQRRIVLVGAAADADTTPPLRRTVRLADRVIEHLLGDDALDPGLEKVCAVLEPARTEPVLDAAAIETARRSLHFDDARPPARVLLWGAAGVGKTLLTRLLAAERARPVLRVDVTELWTEPAWLEDRMARIAREAVLRGAVVILRGGDTLDDDRAAHTARFVELAQRIPGPVVFTAHTRPPWLIHAVPELLEVPVPPPGIGARATLWQHGLAAVAVDPGAIDEVVARFALSGGAILRAAERAVALANVRDPDSPRVGLVDLAESARLVLHHRLGSVARRVTPGFTWDDLVLPGDTTEVIRELLAFAKHRTHLLEAWGFAKKLPYGRGVSAIFAGPPGTGKTMVAQLLARELGYELYLIELAQVVNKYIGETEKNLARVFDEAENSHAILFFDEADALFAKRTEVKSATDRYANLEVNYLLQRMETYDGVTLLATNLEHGIDDAFKRRVRFTVQFELPDEDERERLWKSMFPPEVPLAPNIAWRNLATRYEMAGAYIKKAALRAAARAITRRGRETSVTYADLEEAAQLEYREMGRVG